MSTNHSSASQNLSKLSVLANFTKEDLYTSLRFHFSEEKIHSALQNSTEPNSDKKYNGLINSIISKSEENREKMSILLEELVHFTSHRTRKILPINFPSIQTEEDLSETQFESILSSIKRKISDSPTYKPTIFDFNSPDPAILFYEDNDKVFILKKISIIQTGESVGGAIPKKTIFLSSIIDIKNRIFEYAYNQKDVQELNDFKKLRQESQIDIDEYAFDFIDEIFDGIIDNRIVSEISLLKMINIPHFIYEIFKEDYTEKSRYFKENHKAGSTVEETVEEVMDTLNIDNKLKKDASARVENLVLWDIAFLLSSRIKTDYVFGFSYNDGNITKSQNRHKSRKPIYESSIYWDLMESVKQSKALDSLTLRHQSTDAHVDCTISNSINGLEIHLLKADQERKAILRMSARKELLNDLRTSFRKYLR